MQTHDYKYSGQYVNIEGPIISFLFKPPEFKCVIWQ